MKSFKLINLQSLINRSLFAPAVLLAITVFHAAIAAATTGKAGDYPRLGSFLTTFYYVPIESEFTGPKDAWLLDVAGNVISQVNSKFKKDVDMEGTGILNSGRTVNYAARVNDEVRYRYSRVKYGWGVGTCELKPYHTIAVDPEKIPLGTLVYIPAVKGIALPDGSVHDGYFRAEDIGSRIISAHIDLFAQDGKKSWSPYINAGLGTGKYVDVFKVAEPDPNGCQTKNPETIPLKLAQRNAARVAALSALADEYAALGKAPELTLTLAKLETARGEWEATGRLTAGKSLTRFWFKQERAAISETVLQNDQFDILAAGSSPYAREFNGMTLKPYEVVVTFDDGPHPRLTPLVHATLKKFGIPASFFEVGENVEAHPELTKSLASDGFIIGNHSYNHPELTQLKDEEIADQINKTQKIIQTAEGGADAINSQFQLLFSKLFPYPKDIYFPEFFRSPYGARNARTMKIVEGTVVGDEKVDGKPVPDQFYHVMWNVDSLDWNDHSPKSIEKRVFDELATYGHRGVILMHDIHPQTVDAIQTIFPRLQKEGYKIVTLYDMVAERLSETEGFLKHKP